MGHVFCLDTSLYEGSVPALKKRGQPHVLEQQETSHQVLWQLPPKRPIDSKVVVEMGRLIAGVLPKL